MKLVTFQIACATGAIDRIGAIVGDQVVDLNLATRLQLAASGETARATQIADAMVPPEMIAFFEGGVMSRRAADEALAYVAQNEVIPSLTGEILCHPLAEVTLLAPVPRPRSIRDTLSFEGYMIAFERRTGKKTPPRWYETPIYYKGNPA